MNWFRNSTKIRRVLRVRLCSSSSIGCQSLTMLYFIQLWNAVSLDQLGRMLCRCRVHTILIVHLCILTINANREDPCHSNGGSVVAACGCCLGVCLRSRRRTHGRDCSGRIKWLSFVRIEDMNSDGRNCLLMDGANANWMVVCCGMDALARLFLPFILLFGKSVGPR